MYDRHAEPWGTQSPSWDTVSTLLPALWLLPHPQGCRIRPRCCSRFPPAPSLLPAPMCVQMLVHGAVQCVQGSVAWPAPGYTGLCAWGQPAAEKQHLFPR